MFQMPKVISFDNAEEVKQLGRDHIAGLQSPIEIDVSAIEQANSLAVAILSAWQRTATLQDKSIVFVNLSQELRNIIALSGLDDVLAISPAQ